jgi:hypothetical protein
MDCQVGQPRKGTVMNSDDPDDRDNNHPTIDVTFGENGEVTATAVIDTQISTSLLRDADSVTSIAEGEFLDIRDDLKATHGEGDRAKDRGIYSSVASFPGDDGYVVAQGTLTIEYTRCAATDPPCNDVVGSIVNDAIEELRKWLRTELEPYTRG